MTRTWNTRFFVTALALLALSSTAPATGADSGSEVALHANGVTWQPGFEYDAAVLTIAGPGDVVIRRHFSSDEAIAFDLAGLSGGGLGDGQYVWELGFSPKLSAEVQQKLRSARQSGDATAVEGLKLQDKLPEIEPMSGSFRVKGGSVVTSDRREATRRTPAGPSDGSTANNSDKPVATKDQQILDDLIVVGSACIGQDCNNGESFGFDTLRLKENNLRIKFQDTSNSASFPTRDWQLTANDSSNGGLNKFSIDDIDGGRTPFTIEANAPSHSLYVEDTGQVGFGTSTPVVELHVKDGDTPTLRLEQDGSHGWIPQTWDVAGNETNFFIRDVNHGSKLPFRIRPGAPTSSLDISSTGNVGINTSLPNARLHVLNGDLRVERSTGGGSDHAAIYLAQSGAGTPSEFVIRTNATTGALEIKDLVSGSSGLKFRPGAADNSIVVAPAAGGQVRVGIGKPIPSGTLDVQGTIFLSGAQIHPDFVFESEYDLESIEQHADFMWTNKHLPAMGPGEYDDNGMARFELGHHQVGLLEELEKAHIYIDQLHERLQIQESAISALEERLEALEKGGR